MANGHAVFTLTAEEKASYIEEMRAILIEQARMRQTITYSDLALAMSIYLHPHSYTFANIMRLVCREELAKGHGQLCALIVSKVTGMPGGGYFKGISPLPDDEAMLDAESYWRGELEAVFAYWAEH